MPVQNSDIAEIFEELGDLLEISGENPFKRNASIQLQSPCLATGDL